MRWYLVIVSKRSATSTNDSNVPIDVVITIDYCNYNNYDSNQVALYQAIFAWKSIAKPAEIGQRHHVDHNDTVEDDINRNWYRWVQEK